MIQIEEILYLLGACLLRRPSLIGWSFLFRTPNYYGKHEGIKFEHLFGYSNDSEEVIGCIKLVKKYI